MNILEKFEPKKVFNYFEEISKIPRGSGNEKEISDYLVEFAKTNNLEYIQDKALNVIIKKSATQGYENAPTVILQGHMDMVCEKNKDIEHDFEKDGLKLIIVEDEKNKNELWVKAEGTTLGADNGIAVAYALAILESSDIKHPNLEVVITTDEEQGMTGAENLDTSCLNGRILLNLDSEEENELLVSCAGGIRIDISTKIDQTNSKIECPKCYKLEVKGLKGGHSGADIDKNRGNANKILGEILSDISDKVEILNINGGLKTNAIPRESEAKILVSSANFKIIEEKINELYNNKYGEMIQQVEKDLIITLMEIPEQTETKVFSEKAKSNTINILKDIKNGIKTMSEEVEGLVESSNNLGIIETNEQNIVFYCLARSSKENVLEEIISEFNNFEKVYSDTKVTCSSRYPSWGYNSDSEIRRICEDVHEKMYNKKPIIKAIHAGLECGIFAQKVPGIDMISLGPDMQDIHTPDERLNIYSTKRVYDYLLKILENIK